MDSKGTSIKIKCGVQVWSNHTFSIDEIRSMIEAALLPPFSTTMTTKAVQEMIIYAYHKITPKVSYNKARTYEWGEETTISQCYWDTTVSSVAAITVKTEKFSYPIDKIIHAKDGPAKLSIKMEYTLSPLRSPGLSSSPITEGIICPTLVVPDIIVKYRENHSKRAMSSMMKSDSKTNKDVV